MRERNSSIDAVKGVAIVLVMLGHVFVHNHMEDDYVYDVIKAVQMPLFMIISGYLCGAGRKIENFAMYGKVMKKRAVSYLVPFFAWLTVKHLGNLKAAYQRVFFELDFGLWFLAVLFLLTLFVSTAQLAAAKYREKKPVLSEVIFWLVYGGFCLILLVQCIAGNTFLSPSLTILYVPFYMLGYVAGNYGKKNYKDSRFLQIGVLVFAGLFLALVIKADLDSMTTKLEILQQMVASLLGSLVIIYLIAKWKEGRAKIFFAWLGRYTLEIYVIHYHFANLLNPGNKQYEFYTWEGMLFAAASFLVMSALTALCIWVMKKIKIVDFLFFGKWQKREKIGSVG